MSKYNNIFWTNIKQNYNTTSQLALQHTNYRFLNLLNLNFQWGVTIPGHFCTAQNDIAVLFTMNENNICTHNKTKWMLFIRHGPSAAIFAAAAVRSIVCSLIVALCSQELPLFKSYPCGYLGHLVNKCYRIVHETWKYLKKGTCSLQESAVLVFSECRKSVNFWGHISVVVGWQMFWADLPTSEWGNCLRLEMGQFLAQW